MKERNDKLRSQAACMAALYQTRSRAKLCRQCGAPAAVKKNGTFASQCQNHLDLDAERKKEARKK